MSEYIIKKYFNNNTNYILSPILVFMYKCNFRKNQKFNTSEIHNAK